MTKQGGALAGLWRAIGEYGEAERVHVVSQMLGNGTANIQERLVSIKRGHIDAELAAVEARLVRLEVIAKAAKDIAGMAPFAENETRVLVPSWMILRLRDAMKRSS